MAEPRRWFQSWVDASETGGQLDHGFIKEFFCSEVEISTFFDRSPVDYADSEMAVVSYNGRFEIHLCKNMQYIYIIRFDALAKLLENYHRRHGPQNPFILRFALGDEASDKSVITFCSRHEHSTLIPDAAYIAKRGYIDEAHSYANAKPWRDRINCAYFRGTDSGVLRYSTRLSAPRVAIAVKMRGLDHFDVKISGVEDRADYDAAVAEYTQLGILAGKDPQERILDFRYQIDIDGNTNAWSAFFLKLLSGSPVLKVRSEFKQWFYHKLEPWVNYVPVDENAENLEAVLQTLMADEALAETIGNNGRALALSLSYDSEMNSAADRLAKAALMAPLGLDLTASRRKSMVDRLHVQKYGSANSSLYARLIEIAFDRAMALESEVSEDVLQIPGMSGRLYRMFINNLVRIVSKPRYLEVGSWAGSTCCAAMDKNVVKVVCIDNWSQFGGPKDQFFENVNRVKNDNIDFSFVESDFRSVDVSQLGKFNIYLFDGPHAEQDQYDGLAIYNAALEDDLIFIVDDWNWSHVRSGTRSAILDTGFVVDFSIEIRTTLDNEHGSVHGPEGDWHNGYFISKLKRVR